MNLAAQRRGTFATPYLSSQQPIGTHPQGLPDQAAPSGTDDHRVKQVHLDKARAVGPMPGAGRVAA